MRVPKKATIIFDYGNGITDYTFDLQELYDIIKEKDERIKRALEYIDRRNIDWGSEEHDKLVNILKGSDTNE